MSGIYKRMFKSNSPAMQVEKPVEKVKDSATAWSEKKDGYMMKKGGEKEYNAEKAFFTYNPKTGNIEDLPTDDADNPVITGILPKYLGKNQPK